jgi:hypothetical protein
VSLRLRPNDRSKATGETSEPTSRWRLHEMFAYWRQQMHMWRAVDAEGEVLDVLRPGQARHEGGSQVMRSFRSGRARHRRVGHGQEPGPMELPFAR